MSSTINLFKTAEFKSKTARGLAGEVRRLLLKMYDVNPDYVYVWSPKEAQRRGYGSGWTVCAEEVGVYDWPIKLAGVNETLHKHPHAIAEPYNSFILSFYPRE